MVYCGKPSKACGECRARRTKCDYAKPNCSQCIRMGRTCSGYRNPVDTMFRDESDGFATKRQKLKKPKKAPRAASRKSSKEIDQAFAACSIAFESSRIPLSAPSCLSPITLDLDSSRESSETCFAFEDNFLEPQKLPHSKVSTISEEYRKEVRDRLMETLASLGSNAGFSKSWSSSDIMIDTHLQYNMAFLDQMCPESQFNDEIAAFDINLGYSSQSSESDAQDYFEMDDMFNFDCFADTTSIAPPLRNQDPYYNCNPTLRGLSDSTDMQALCYFFANYVLEDTSTAKGYLNYLPNLCTNEDGSSYLMDAVTSLGLVGLAMKKHDQNALNAAQLKYASALRELNAGLTSGDGALTDQALTTVFLMGLYETNTCSTPHNIRAWTKHIRGAIAMLQLRGKQQLESPFGRQIFLQWRSQIIAYCHHRRIAIPEFVLEWSRELLEHEPDDIMATTLLLTTSRLCSLRADMQYFRNYSKSATAVPWAMAVDAELEEDTKNWPESYERRAPTPAEQSDFIYGDYFDVYSSVTVATIWNENRRMRMLCHEIILQHLPHLRDHRAEYPDFDLSDQEVEKQLQTSQTTLDSLSQDICASVSFFFGVHMNDGGMKSGELAPKAVCGNLLLRPLYMAAEPIFISNDVRNWVIGRFEKVAEVMGVQQATAMGHLVSIGIDPDQWENTIRD